MPASLGALVPQRPSPLSPWHSCRSRTAGGRARRRRRSSAAPGVRQRVDIREHVLARGGSATVCDIGAICAPNVSPSSAPRTPCLKFSSWRRRYQSSEPRELRRVELLVALALRRRGRPSRPRSSLRPAVALPTGRACVCANVGCVASHVCVRRPVRRRPAAAHREVADAAELLAEDSYVPGLRRREPQVRHEARHEVHLHAELRHGEVVQHVGRAQQHLARA